MMMRHLLSLFLTNGLLSILMLAGCTTPATHYYLLDSIHTGKKSESQQAGMAVHLQVEIPHYLDRPRMVSRDANNQLHIAEYHQWGGRLRENIGRVLADNLSTLPAFDTIVMSPLPGAPDAENSLIVDIRKFERLADGHVHLAVRWHLLRRGVRVYSHYEDLKSELPVAENDYAGMAAAMSRLLGRLSEHMAAGVGSVEKQR